MHQTVHGENFEPDFFLLAPHGVGTLSLIYYLSHLGLLASLSPYDLDVYKDGKLITARFPLMKSDTLHGLGITYDRIIPDIKPLRTSQRIHVVQIVRDPVDQLTSLINFFIAECICGRESKVPFLNKNLLLECINYSIGLSCSYASLLNQIDGECEVLYLETNDISGQRCIDSLNTIANFFDITYSIDDEQIFSIPYNSFENRIWSYQTAKRLCFPHDLKEIKVFPAYLHDYATNQIEKTCILDRFIYNEYEYVVTIPISAYSKNSIDSLLFDDETREAMKRYIDIFIAQINTYSMLYNTHKISWHEVVAAIKADTSFHRRFMKFMEYQLNHLITEVPDMVEQWHHFHCL